MRVLIAATGRGKTAHKRGGKMNWKSKTLRIVATFFVLGIMLSLVGCAGKQSSQSLDNGKGSSKVSLAENTAKVIVTLKDE